MRRLIGLHSRASLTHCPSMPTKFEKNLLEGLRDAVDHASGGHRPGRKARVMQAPDVKAVGKSLTLSASPLRYFHTSDERAFFEWLGRIECVERAEGTGRELQITLRRRPGQEDLRELLALFFRYHLDMRQIARFENSRNRSWFRDPRKYWYRRVFGATLTTPTPA